VSSILYGNSTPNIGRYGYVQTEVSYSLVPGWYSGWANLPSSDPEFVSSPHWLECSSVTYDPAALSTALMDESQTWVPGELAGQLLVCDGTWRWFLIEDNSASTIWVLGDAEPYVAPGDECSVRDLRLSETSPCIDAGDGELAPPLDYLGLPRVDGPGDNVGNGPPWTDMGAYEYQ
jgi:hypothetical protein